MADAARKVIFLAFDLTLLIAENKTFNGFDPVTDADKVAEKVMIR